MNAAIPVLLYHSVADASTTWGAVSPRLFDSHVEAIAASGRTAVSVDRLAAGLSGQATLPELPVAVTFDDGYEDTPAAVQRLLAHGIPAAVYVTTGTLGQGPHVDAGQVAQLAVLDGVTVGAHGVQHVRLDELGADAISRELTASRARLEEIVHARVDSFAYPHGAYHRGVRAAAAEAGYRSAMAVKNAFSHPGDDPLAVARLTVTAEVDADQLAAWLDGRGAPVAWKGERLRTRAYRVARRQRRRALAARGAPC